MCSASGAPASDVGRSSSTWSPPPAAGWCHGQQAGSRWEPLGENTAGKGSSYTIVTLQPGLKSRNINNRIVGRMSLVPDQKATTADWLS